MLLTLSLGCTTGAPALRTADGGPIPTSGFTDAGVHPGADVGPPGDGLGEIWSGHIEMYALASGSDAVRIVFDAPTAAARTGTVYFGAGAGPAAATDPNVGYPPDLLSQSYEPGRWLAEGFGYRFDGATVTSSRVQFEVDLGTLWAGWCSLQYPIDQGGGSYGCLPNTGGSSRDGECTYRDPSTGTPLPIECGRASLCGASASVCSCSSTECTAAAGGTVTFDFHVVGDDGSGTVRIDAMRAVRLTRER